VQMAGALAEAELFDGGWKSLFSSLEIAEGLTVGDFQKAAASLSAQQSVVGFMHPGEGEDK